LPQLRKDSSRGNSQVSITTIAGICGHCDLYFRKVFKAAEGVTPQETRRLHQES
jgi:transcriptional regulator GlxA family with amidase domain